MKQQMILTLGMILFPVTLLAAGPLAPSSGSNLGSVTGGEFKEANVLIKRKCTSCHNDDRIQKALAAGRDMQLIQQQMEKKGVQLSAGERSVLGVFWKETPLKTKK